MAYTNFAYYYAPHGWYPRHDPLKFITREYMKRTFSASDAVNKYLTRRLGLEMGCWAIELKNLRVASGRYGYMGRPQNMGLSINHMQDDDIAYYNDELAASCGL